MRDETNSNSVAASSGSLIFMYLAMMRSLPCAASSFPPDSRLPQLSGVLVSARPSCDGNVDNEFALDWLAPSRFAQLLWLGPARAVNCRETIGIRIVGAAQNGDALLHRSNLRGLRGDDFLSEAASQRVLSMN